MAPPETPDLASPYKNPAVTGFEGQTFKLDERRERVSRAMSGFFLGPMPAQAFLDQYLPKPESTTPRRPPRYFSKVPINSTEAKMYDPFIKLVKDFIPRFKIVNTGSNPDSNSDPQRKIKPDPTMYKTSVDTLSGKTQFDKAEMNIEFKRDKSWEPFVDSAREGNYPFEANTLKGRHTRAQLIDYMAEVFSRQHRIFGFSLFICDDMARFIRWDRAGVVVSAQFNYHDSSELLIEFFWRSSHLDDASRGHDPNVRLATAKEVEDAEEKLSKWKPERKRPFIVFTVPGEDKKLREFVAWKPFTAPYSVTGRCTRAYPVYEIATNKCYFLKDLWRADALDPEANILRRLAEENVSHVPKFLCGGDIVGETTMTNLCVEKSPTDKTRAEWLVGNDWSCITRRIHHRFVVDFIGKPLNTIENSKQLMQVTFDAYTGGQEAYEKCGFIHRDISGRNILIDENGRGVLNDWDLAKHKDELGQLRKHERTGTWQFMSVLLLSRHHYVHTIQDDMESFIYVMIYFGLRYLQHNYDGVVPVVLKEVFDYEDINNDGLVVGGRQKRLLLGNYRVYLNLDFKFLSAPFQRWFEWAVVAANQWIEHCQPTVKTEIEATQGAESKQQLYDHSNMAQKFIECLNSQDWPIDEPHLKDAGAKADGGTTRTSKRAFASEYIEEDGSIGGSRKQSRTSNATGPRGSNSQRANKQVSSQTRDSRGGSDSQQVREDSTSRIRGSCGGFNSQREQTSRARGSQSSLNSQQANEQSTSETRGSRGGSNSKRSMQLISEHSMTTRSRTKSSHGG